MYYHTFVFGVTEPYHFSTAYLFVDYFFILTGYLTMKHFASAGYVGINERAEQSIQYTFKKFGKFMPYTTIAIFFEYIMDNFHLLKHSTLEFVVSFSDMPYEMLLLSQFYKNYPNVNTLWYLSAMLIVFPIFCYTLQSTNKSFLKIISPLFPMFFWGHVGRNWVLGLQ